MKVEDEVWTLVKKYDIPARTFGVVTEINGEGIWVDVYIPADNDVPEDTVCYREDELEVT